MKPNAALILAPMLVLSLPSIAGAQTVRPQQRINAIGSNPGSDNAYGLGLAAQGSRIVAVWCEEFGTVSTRKDAYFSLSNNFGITWTTQQRIDTGDGANVSNTDDAKVVITDDGTIVAIFEDEKYAQTFGSSNEDLLYNRSTDGGVTWLPAALPLNVPTSGPSVESDVDAPFIFADGNSVYVVWEEDAQVGLGGNEEIWFTKSTDAGATWSTAMIITPHHASMGDADDPRIAASGNNVVVAYVDNVDASDDIWILHSDDGGATWSAASEENNKEGTAECPVLDVDGDLFVVAYEDSDPSSPAQESIHAMVSTDGGANWDNEETISERVSTTTGAEGLWSDVEVHGDNIYIVYAEDSESLLAGGLGEDLGSKVYAGVSNDQGSNWTLDIALDPLDPRRNHRPSVVATDDTVYVHLETGINNDNRVAYSISQDEGATWSTPVQVVNSGPDTDTESPTKGRFLAVAADGTAISIYWDSPTGTNEVYVSGIELGSSTIGDNFCMSTPNSTGQPAVISGTGSADVSLNAFVLVAQPIPVMEPGIFYYGLDAISFPFGNGTRCVGGPEIYRLSVEMTDANNMLTHAVDFDDPPTASGQITAGSTWRFQAWFRDPAAGGAFFDLSDGLVVTYLP